MRWQGRMADEVRDTRAMVARAQALLQSVPFGRIYKRDKDGKFGTGGGDGTDPAALPDPSSGTGVEGLPRLSDAPSVQTAAEGANPDYGSSLDNPKYRDAAARGEKWDPSMGPPPSGAYEENCTNCVQAFEMRMRGYDVKAAPLEVLDEYGYASGRTPSQVDEQLASAYSLPGGAPHGRSFASQPFRSLGEIDKEVKGWPEGGRGYVHVGKHVFAAVKKNGKTEFIEPQFDPHDGSSSRIVTKEYKKRYPGKGAKVVRLDDLEPADGIMEAVVAR